MTFSESLAKNFGEGAAHEMAPIFTKITSGHITAAIIYGFAILSFKHVKNQRLQWGIFAACFCYGTSFLVAGSENLVMRIAAISVVLMLALKEYLLPARRKRHTNTKKRAKNIAK